jgi:alkyldihydroxyacetonephosphate synthase
MDREELSVKLKDLLDEGNFSFREDDLFAYARDAWPRTTIELQKGKIEHLPDAVVWPSTKEQVVKIVRFANENLIPLIPFGGGSGVCGGTYPVNGGIIVDLKKLEKIIRIDEKSLTLTAEAGIIGERLERALNEKGFTLGHFPSSIYCSTLGGWLATRSAGQLSTKYGKIEDMVLSLEVVLPDGRVVRTKPSPRSAAGPNLTQIFVGSEGVLGIITEAVLKIWRLPEKRAFSGIMFESVENGLEAIRTILQSGVYPSVVRLYDELDTFMIAEDKTKQTSSSRQLSDDNLKKDLFHRAERFFISHPEVVKLLSPLLPKKCLLILGFEGEEEHVELDRKIALEMATEKGGKNLGEEPGMKWWETRYRVSYGLSPVFYIGGFADTIEVATTWDNVLNLYYSMKAAIGEHALVLAHFSHAYHEGCSIYFTFAGSAPDDRKEALYEKILKSAMDACVSAGGTISHHHGIGYSKQRWLKQEYTGGLEILRELKKIFDPNNIMNPGKLGLV